MNDTVPSLEEAKYLVKHPRTFSRPTRVEDGMLVSTRIVDRWACYIRGRFVVQLPWISVLGDEFFMPSGSYGGRILS